MKKRRTMMSITIEDAAAWLRENDNYIILTHKAPDGDTLGSSHALCRALQSIGKRARIVTECGLPRKFLYLEQTVSEQSFDAEHIIAVDIADESLLPKNAEQYRGRVELCIDHHESNSCYAAACCIERNAAACAEVVFKIITALGAELDRQTASCLFTGLTTDTGCFRYSNVTAQTMNTAARLVELGCDSYKINKLMFETNSKQRIAIEQMALSTIEYHDGGRIAVMLVTLDMLEKSGADDSELEGLSAVPRTIEGVAVGITIRQKPEGILKISVRSDETLCSANRLCSLFGGGGHAAAGGCVIKDMTVDEAKARLVAAAEDILNENKRG